MQELIGRIDEKVKEYFKGIVLKDRWDIVDTASAIRSIIREEAAAYNNGWTGGNGVSNADKIRRMTDGELAEMLCMLDWKMTEYQECLQWLKQEQES